MNGNDGPGATDRRVLIVEDERATRRALQALLNANGFRATAYESAEDALNDLAHGATPAYVVVDVDLPGMSGLELTTRLLEKVPDLTVILATACDAWRVSSFLQKHACHYLRKPVDIGRLLRLLGASERAN